MKMSNREMYRWVFRAHVLDRAGALTSIASAFSNEGVSIDTIVGHGFEERAGVDGSVVLTFYCSEAEKDKMVRKVQRLSKVIQLEEHPTSRRACGSRPSFSATGNSSRVTWWAKRRS